MPLVEFPRTQRDPRTQRLAGGHEPEPFETEGRLYVAEPRPPTSWLLGALLIAAVALGLFLMLNGRRLQRVEPAFPATPPLARSAPTQLPELPDDLGLAEPKPAPPPAPVAEPEPEPQPAPTVVEPLPQPTPPEAPQRTRMTGTPALVFEYGPRSTTSANSAGRGISGGAATPAGAGSSDDGPRLDALASGEGGEGDAERVTATRLRNPGSVVPRGAVIPAVLETAIDSDLPGLSRAVVSEDVLSFDGSAVLIPKGSRLIGRYRSDLVPGQSRVFVVWNSVIRPDGATIELASPGTDELGRGGLEGKVDRRFGERYGGPILLTTLNAGLNALSAARSQIMIAAGGIGTTATAGGSAKPVGPVVKVQQGARIRVFVARELDFSTVGGVPLKAASPP